MLTTNARAPQTPAVHSNPTEGTVSTVHHQNGPVTIPIDEPLPSGYLQLIFYFQTGMHIYFNVFIVGKCDMMLMEDSIMWIITQNQPHGKDHSHYQPVGN